MSDRLIKRYFNIPGVCIAILNRVMLLVAHMVEALRYKPEGRGLGSLWGHWNFSLTIFSAKLWSWGRLRL